jgi:hypothetical protein
MFDPVGTFAKQFTPFENGYIYYPSRNSGGKFVTSVEFEKLISDWREIFGTKAIWKMAGLAMLTILVFTIISQIVELPTWVIQVVNWGILLAIVARIIRGGLSARRLVRDRPPITPPRSISEARREARAALPWSMIIVVSSLSGLIFFAQLLYPEPTMSSWAWRIGSGLMLAAYLWIGWGKLRDR